MCQINEMGNVDMLCDKMQDNLEESELDIINDDSLNDKIFCLLSKLWSHHWDHITHSLEKEV